jgi:hypothetical protein
MKAQSAAMKRARRLEPPERTVKDGLLLAEVVRVAVSMVSPFRGRWRQVSGAS